MKNVTKHKKITKTHIKTTSHYKALLLLANFELASRLTKEKVPVCAGRDRKDLPPFDCLWIKKTIKNLPNIHFASPAARDHAP